MMRLRSLRWQILLGAFLWTLGILPIGHMFFLVVTGRGRALWRFAGIFHVGLSITLPVLALVCLAAGFVQVRQGLQPLGQLRTRLSAVRDGHEHRIEGAYPAEVQPLVNDLNSLLEHREKAVQRALAKAGDLAHGLKTPLAVLAQEADRLDAEGQHEVADTFHQQVERMCRQVDYHLAHARAATSGETPGAKTSMRCWGICWTTRLPPIRPSSSKPVSGPRDEALKAARIERTKGKSVIIPGQKSSSRKTAHRSPASPFVDSFPLLNLEQSFPASCHAVAGLGEPELVCR